MSRIAAVLGVGPGLGRALALKFAKEGMKVALMSRSLDKLEPVEKDIKEKYNGEAFSIPTDAGSEPSVKNAYDKIVEKWGAAPELFVFNAGSFTPGGILETSLEQFEKNLHINCTSAFIALKQFLPDMVSKKKGTVIITGATASLRGGKGFSNLAVGKFGLRALAQSAAREFGPQGVHVAHVIVDGMIDTGSAYVKDKDPNTILCPDEMANTYWHLHTQHPTVWTHELDVRPSTEKW